MGEFDHSITNDLTQEEALMHVKQNLEEQKLQEQVIDGEPIGIVPDNIKSNENVY